MSGVSVGKYRLIAELGRGGMAEVFLAVASSADAGFSKLVVLKKPRPHLAEDMDFITMFVDEARIAARLNHPNLVQTLEVGEVDGQYYLTMEYLDGQPLHRILHRARATIPLENQLAILADVLAGIHSAHELKDFDGTPLEVVHRDVTPHNVFVTYDGQVKVVDFGIARAVGRISETRHGVVKGKTPYMAPEQASSQTLDRRVDVFAVGVMLYEAITRRRMWKGVSETDIVRRLIVGDIPNSPKEVDPSVDDELDKICRKSLEANPADRYKTAAEMQDALEEYLSKKGRPTSRQTGALVTSLFADKRETTNKIIESQLSQLRSEAEPRAGFGRLSVGRMPASSVSSIDSRDSSSTPSSSTPSSSTPSTSTPSRTHTSVIAPGHPAAKPAAPAAPATVTTSSGSAPPTMVMAAPAPRRPTGTKPIPTKKSNPVLPLAIVAIALTLATTGLTIVAFSMGRRASNGSSTKPAEPSTITVTLRATPLETTFSIDNGPPLENPYIGHFPSDDVDHVIRVVAPGMMPQVRSVKFSSDVSMRFTLSGAHAPAPSAAPHKK